MCTRTHAHARARAHTHTHTQCQMGSKVATLTLFFIVICILITDSLSHVCKRVHAHIYVHEHCMRQGLSCVVKVLAPSTGRSHCAEWYKGTDVSFRASTSTKKADAGRMILCRTTVPLHCSYTDRRQDIGTLYIP